MCTEGKINDVDEEMLEFLNYIEHTTEQVAALAKSDLVKVLHQKVNEVKADQSLEVEWMTLLERDREKREEGIEIGRQEATRQTAKNLFNMGMEIEKIAMATGLSKEEIETFINS